MRVLIEAHHPAHIHFWKYPIRALQERGHKVLMVARDRDVMRRLLRVYDWIDAEIPARSSRNNRFPLLEMLQRQYAVARAIHQFHPDVVASLMGSYTQSARLMGVKNIIFTDTEHQGFNHRIAHPFANEIHTPECFHKDLGGKQHRYPSVHEMSFLGHKHFNADKSVLERNNLEAYRYVVVRLSAWNTFHDVGEGGIGEGIYAFVEKSIKYGPVLLIAEEGKVPPGLECYATATAPEDFHSLLAYARFVLSEGASTASEACCLGTPTVYINSNELMGYLRLLEEKTGILHNFSDISMGIRQAMEILEELSGASVDTVAAERDSLRKSLADSMIDPVQYVVDILDP